MSKLFGWFQYLKTVAACIRKENRLLRKDARLKKELAKNNAMLAAVRARKAELKGEEVTEG